MLDKTFGRNTIIYYVFLLLILVTWTNVNSLPPLPLRLAYLIAVMVPLWKSKSLLAPLVLFTFVVISGSSYAVSYMPVDGLYISIVLALLYLKNKQSHDRLKLPVAFIILTILAFAVDLINDGDVNFFFKLLAVILASLFIPKSDEDTLKFTTLTIVLISFVIAMEFVIMGGDFSQTVSTIEGEIDRKGWADPNYFGAVLGYGVIASFIALQKWPNMQKKVKYSIVITLLLSLYTILLIASRGIFLAIVASVLILFFNGSLSINKKLSLFFMMLFGAFIFYQLGFFDLIILRFISDAGDAGGRTEIWLPRMTAFFNECTPLQWLFGIGTDASMTLGTNQYVGFHNDYLAILVRYGIVGFVCLLGLLFKPFIDSCRDKGLVKVALLYLALCMFSIEPFSGGQWGCLYFYLYILVLSQIGYERAI